MSTTASRLDALEAENARLRGEVEALKPPPAPAPSPVPPVVRHKPEEARIYRGVAGFPFKAPTEDEMRRLLAIVLGYYPMLAMRPTRHDHPDAAFISFRAAFLAIGMTGRTVEPVDNIALSFYEDFFVHELLKPIGVYADVNGGTWAAVVAHCDVPFRPIGSNGASFGLAYRVNSGRPADDAWRRLLAGAAPPKATHPERPVRQLSATPVASW